ncbi:uncharacterized protein si:ch211-171b20.3 [Lepisosteus oculatus]|uniref:uncharacterized protein si:ch211-171b20.3 n=1 Tax=Lepisosteus oculatus TaxID=7918 RepID=UPI00371DB08E
MPKLVTTAAASDLRDRGPSSLQLLEGLGALGQHIQQANLRLAAGKPSALPPRRKHGGAPSPHLQGRLKDIKDPEAKCIIEGSKFSSLVLRDYQRVTTSGFESRCSDMELSERPSLFHKKWRNDMMEFKYDVQEKRLPKANSSAPSLPRDFLIQKSSPVHRLSLHKELSQGPSKPFASSSYAGCDLPSVPEVFLPATTSPAVKQQNVSVETCMNRPRISNRSCSLFTIGALQKSHVYADPVPGAPTSFIQRLSEISYLECETVRQEKIKKLKKGKKQES